jgi:hypothetical protein
MDAARAALTDGCTRRGASGRPPGHQRHRACAQERLPLVRLPGGLWPVYDDLQPLRALGAARNLGKSVPGTGRERSIRRHADDRLHPRQGAPLGSGRKRGEQKQAVGRSRGGRNTKIYALGDAKGRLIAILLTGGEAHDCPVAERLIRRVKPAKRMLGDKAYDSAELREDLDERGTSRSFPIAATEGNRSASTNVSTGFAGGSRMPSTD